MIAPVFLSASEPNPQRRPEYWDSRKLLNVREAVRAFCGHALAYYPVVFGGHPAIAPLVRNVASRIAHDAKLGLRDHGANPRVMMFQSALFFDPDRVDPGNETFSTALTPPLDREGNVSPPKHGWRNESLLSMRYQMIGRRIDEGFRSLLQDDAERNHWMLHRYGDSLGAARRERFGTYDFSAAVFIGGMEGVEREYRIFRAFHPHTPAFPIGSTGSACERLLDEVKPHLATHRYEELQTTTAYSLLMQQILPPPMPRFAFDDRAGWRADGPPPQPFRLEDHTDPKDINKEFPPKR